MPGRFVRQSGAVRASLVPNHPRGIPDNSPGAGPITLRIRLLDGAPEMRIISATWSLGKPVERMAASGGYTSYIGSQDY